jgi:phage tail tape-measure protein
VSEIVERLRGFWGDVSNRDIIEAADEIERLRAALDSITKVPRSEAAYAIIQVFARAALPKEENDD